MSNTYEILKVARDFFHDEHSWTQSTYGEYIEEYTDPYEEGEWEAPATIYSLGEFDDIDLNKVSCLCLDGALAYASTIVNRSYDKIDHINAALEVCEVLGLDSMYFFGKPYDAPLFRIHAFNDDQNTNFESVCRALDKAIENLTERK